MDAKRIETIFYMRNEQFLITLFYSIMIDFILILSGLIKLKFGIQKSLSINALLCWIKRLSLPLSSR